MGVYASLTYRDVDAAIEHLERVFGFVAVRFDDGTGSAVLRHGDGMVVLQRERPEDLHGEHAGRAWVYVVVDDVDAHYHLAKAEGAELLGEVQSVTDGAQRGYSARDPEGNLWTFGRIEPA